MELNDGLPVTEAQWTEHSDAWRLAHLHRAPSASLRQQAIAGPEPATELGASRRQGWASLPHLTLEMMLIVAVMAVVVIGAAFR
jgi:hypothetical protein